MNLYNALDQVLSDSAPLITVVGSDRFLGLVIRFVKARGLSKTVIQLDIKNQLF